MSEDDARREANTVQEVVRRFRKLLDDYPQVASAALLAVERKLVSPREARELAEDPVSRPGRPSAATWR